MGMFLLSFGAPIHSERSTRNQNHAPGNSVPTKEKKPKAPPWKVRWVPAHVIIDISLRSCSCSSCFSTLRRGDFFLPLEQNHKHTFSLLRIHICRRVVAEICREIVIRRNCAGRCVDPWTSAASSVVAWTILSSFLTGAFSGKRCAAWREAKSFN